MIFHDLRIPVGSFSIVRTDLSIVFGEERPMLRIEHALQGWVAFLIVPLFALANAGVAFGDDPLRGMTEPITLGVLLGLVIGKQVGITLAAFAVVRLGLASLPRGVTWRHIYGAAWLGGIGFTMSLSSVLVAYLLNSTSWSPVLCGLIAIAMCVAIGFVNAFVVVGLLLRPCDGRQCEQSECEQAGERPAARTGGVDHGVALGRSGILGRSYPVSRF